VYFKHFLGEALELEDLSGSDPQMYKSLRYLDTAEDIESLELYFAATGVGKRNYGDL
jgi:hypothetical protein